MNEPVKRIYTDPVALAPKASIVFALLHAFSVAGWAVQLPVRTYTTADGLPRNWVNCLVPDSRGFLWLCTPEGLSRFDGYQFRTYGGEQGLPSPVVNAFVQTRAGMLVVGTKEGLAVLRPHPDELSHRRFEVYLPGPSTGEREINALLEDRSGVLWCGTSGGLFRVRWTGSSPHFEGVFKEGGIAHLAQDDAGNIWVAVSDQGLLEVTPASEIRRYGEQQGIPYFVSQGRHNVWINALAVDAEGTVWVGMHSGLCRLRRHPALDGGIVDRIFTTQISRNYSINCLYVSRSGRLWVGSRNGASEWTGDPNRPFRHWGAAEGITDRGVQAIGEDGAGNLWIATGEEGAKRVASNGLLTYTHADGLGRNMVSTFTEGRNGDLFALTNFDSLDLNRFDGERFTAIHPALPPNIRYLGWGSGSTVLEDHKGDWWLATGEGLCRFDGHNGPAGLARTPPKAVYTRKDGLASDDIFKLFEDSRGDIWLATNGPTSVSRWDRASGSFQRPPVLDANDRTITAFAEDGSGSVWVGTSVGIFRWRAGRLERMDREGVPPESAAALYADRSRRLWVGSRQGLFRCDNPRDDSPNFQKVVSEAVGCVTEDRWGRMYACTGRGVTCLDPASGRLRRFTTADGLGPGRLMSVYTDRRGDIWFGLTMSASRFTPQPDTTHAAAPIYITSIRSSGRNVLMAEAGETAVGSIALRPYENFLEVDFVGIELGTGRWLEYEYKLDGAQREWQPLGRERSVHFASLAPGRYRLLVRAVNNDGVATESPASLDLFVATPVWRRWWSIMLMVTVAAAGLYTAHRWRMRYLLELEHVRTRIATDLHDDVGASLSQVAIMSEVVSRRSIHDRKALDEIAATSRELLQSMSEIVWAVDPSHDRLHDLIQRMRWFAGETFSGRGISLHFLAAGEERELHLNVETRRQVFLIFKESVNNIARHAEARHAKVVLKADENWLVLEVADDGCGFEGGPPGGHGLRNMAERARALGGSLEVNSCPGYGTRLALRVPLDRSPRWGRWLVFLHKHAGSPETEARRM